MNKTVTLVLSAEEVGRLYAALKYRAGDDDRLVKTLAFALAKVTER